MEISMISADLSMKELRPSGARVLAAFLPKCTYVVLYTCLYPLSIAQSDIPDTLSDNSALRSLNLSSNRIGKYWAKNTEGTQALSTVFTGNSVLTDLDLSHNGFEAEDASLLADVMPGMGALTTVIMHKYPLPIEDIKTKAELDLSGKGLVYLDAIIIAALLPLNVSRQMCRYPCCHLSLLSLC
jgi:hypothetical protein